MFGQRWHNSWVRQGLKIYEKCIERERVRRFCHVSFILQGNRLMTYGNNNLRTHPISQKYGYPCSMHSEVHASIRLPSLKFLEGATLINIKFQRKVTEPQVMISCPCTRCMHFLAEHGVRRVIYSTDYGKWDEWTPDMGIFNPYYGPLCDQ